MKTLNFKHSIEKLGYKVEKYVYGYNFRSAFASKDGQLWYFHIEDLRDEHPFVYRRTVKSLEDYTGGPNSNDVEFKLEQLGYKIVEKRKQKYDFNSL